MAAAKNPWRGVLREHEPLAKHTSWRVGGPADRFYIPADLADLAAFLASVPAPTPVTFIGLGSNLLVRDGGVRGVVVATSGALNGLAKIDAEHIRAEAGVASAKLARFSVQQGFSGVEFLAGIPGTIGGALAMNAGAFGGETWPWIAQVETIDRFGVIRTRAAAEYRVGYRSVVAPADEWFVAGIFRLHPLRDDGGGALIKSLLAKRGATQPTQLPNAGSVFRNPPGDHAARLIEAAGLKGTREGRACVSTLHANFIVNDGGASAADIERLIARVRASVHARFGVELETEVRTIGEPA